MYEACPTSEMREFCMQWLCKMRWETTLPEAKVIYGDTDSVMVSFGDSLSFADAKIIGDDIDRRASMLFENE